jgi:hypothetical protein
MENTFNAATYIRKGHNTSELRLELNKMELDELKKIYKGLTEAKLKTKVAKNKELLIDEIVTRTLNVVNFAWVFKADEPKYK